MTRKSHMSHDFVQLSNDICLAGGNGCSSTTTVGGCTGGVLDCNLQPTVQMITMAQPFLDSHGNFSILFEHDWRWLKMGSLSFEYAGAVKKSRAKTKCRCDASGWFLWQENGEIMLNLGDHSDVWPETMLIKNFSNHITFHEVLYSKSPVLDQLRNAKIGYLPHFSTTGPPENEKSSALVHVFQLVEAQALLMVGLSRFATGLCGRSPMIRRTLTQDTTSGVNSFREMTVL